MLRPLRSWLVAAGYALLILVGGVLWSPAGLAATGSDALCVAQAGPQQARIGAFVTSLSDINEAQRRFDITFWLWTVAAAPASGPELAKSLEIPNAAIVERQYTSTTPTSQGQWTQVKFKASIRAPLDLQDYPFDRHTLRIHIEDSERDSQKLVFIPDLRQDGDTALTMASDLNPSDWRITRHQLLTSIHRENTTYGDPNLTGGSAFARATLEIDIQRRNSGRQLLMLLLGSITAILVAFCATMLPAQLTPPRFGLISGALFVAITNRLHVDSKLPAMSTFGMLDQMQFLMMGGIVLLTVFCLVLTNQMEGDLDPKLASIGSRRFGFIWLTTMVVAETVIMAMHHL